MKPILILLSPAFGHYHATYKLAAQLKEKGYRIIYAGENNYRESVELQGFEFQEFSFASLARDQYTRIAYFQWRLLPYFFSNLFKRNRKERYQHYVQLSHQAKELISNIHPAVILLDWHIGTLYLLLIQTTIPCVQICTTLSTHKDRWVPPLNSGLIPKQNRMSKIRIGLLWFRQSVQQRLDYAFQKIMYVGKDNDSFLRKLARQHGVEVNRIVKHKVLRLPLIPVPELITAPEIFDYPWRTHHSQLFHIGPSVLKDRVEVCDEEMLAVLDDVEKRRKENHLLRVVYCSLGTINFWQNRNCLQFFKKVLKAFENKTDWFVIMAIGKDIPMDRLGDIPDNISVFAAVPQLKVLQHCDAMITHGGLNTTKECILAGVPMVVYPLSNLWDQEGNAARVTFHKIGLRGKLEKDSAQDIIAKVNNLFIDPDFKKHVVRMSEEFKQQNDSETGVSVIENLINEESMAKTSSAHSSHITLGLQKE